MHWILVLKFVVVAFGSVLSVAGARQPGDPYQFQPFSSLRAKVGAPDLYAVLQATAVEVEETA